MTDKPSSIKNLGPASDEFYARAGITTADQLRDLGPDEAYFRALKAGGKAHFIGFYVLVMALQGRPWNDCKGKEKDALKVRFEAIKARLSPADKGLSVLEKELNMLGVVKKD
ncbi:TfoX/Sxy family DNA transformation protein [Amylibacter sp. IMCC11727]|uniref:TfoX/Sxy family DNA transformation protein n=1 Tax=Amylibacter sp. IMCC11727 TaxID=3039851 RepID=UPI00244E3BA4|nr:TfoX/Sxy family DNA transformation protein [Amylibacter sp. IMCC11727]WGI20753.1 TfoX/Sxy family DNA transformation protein [Amylibacter sp. IMCC11727]